MNGRRKHDAPRIRSRFDNFYQVESYRDQLLDRTRLTQGFGRFPEIKARKSPFGSRKISDLEAWLLHRFRKLDMFKQSTLCGLVSVLLNLLLTAFTSLGVAMRLR